MHLKKELLNFIKENHVIKINLNCLLKKFIRKCFYFKKENICNLNILHALLILSKLLIFKLIMILCRNVLVWWVRLLAWGGNLLIFKGKIWEVMLCLIIRKIFFKLELVKYLIPPCHLIKKMFKLYLIPKRNPSDLVFIPGALALLLLNINSIK